VLRGALEKVREGREIPDMEVDRIVAVLQRLGVVGHVDGVIDELGPLEEMGLARALRSVDVILQDMLPRRGGALDVERESLVGDCVIQDSPSPQA